MAKQFFLGRCLGIGPFLNGIGHIPVAKRSLEGFLAVAFVEHLLGAETGQQLVDVLHRAFGGEKLTRADVEQGQSAGRAPEVDGCQEIVLLIVEHRVHHGHTWSDHLRDAPLHQRLGELGVLQLVTDSHTLAGSHQLGQIGVECMIGEARHFRG